MSSKSFSDKLDQNVDLITNQSKKFNILGRDMSYNELANLVEANLQCSTSMDIALEVLDKKESVKGGTSVSKPSDEIVVKPLIQGRMLSHIDNFSQFSWVGHGAFSIVLNARHRIDRSNYALKVIPNISTMNQLFVAYREVKTLTRLINLHVVRYYTCWMEPNRISAKKTESDIYDENGFVDLDKIIKRYKLNGGEGTTDVGESGEEENQSEMTSSQSFNDFELALPDRRTQFTNEYLSKNPVSLVIQMELCSSNLKDWLSSCPAEFRDEKSVSLRVEYRKQVRWLFDQIVLGLFAIHDSLIIHRDIKPVNIFIHGAGEGQDFFFGSGNCPAFGSRKCKSETCYHRLTVKIGDFGLSKVLDDPVPNGEEEGRTSVNSSMRHRGMLTADVGTLFYVAPEVISATGDRWTKYNERADIYALGVVLLQMLHYCKTEMEMARIADEIKLPKYLYELWPVEGPLVFGLDMILGFYGRLVTESVAEQFKASASLKSAQALAELLTRMLSKDPNSRPSALEIKDTLAPTSEIINVDCLEVREMRREIESLKVELDRQRQEADAMRRRMVELEMPTLFYS